MSIRFRERTDVAFRYIFRFSGMLTIGILGGIFAMLLYNSAAFFLNIHPIDFFTRMEWNPGSNNGASYGIVPLLVSTILVTTGALLIAVPLGIATAAFMAQLAPRKLQAFLKPCVEMLAAIPSVAIGFLGIVVIGPAIAKLFGLQNGLNALNGAILLAVMALPTIITVSEDAIHAVPLAFKEASYALGADKWTTLFKITIPSSAPGLIAAVMLGMGRAIGETMTVLMATGNASAFPKGFLHSIRTITATIAIEMGEVPYQTTHYYALFAIAAVLFIITLGVNLAAEALANKFRKYQY